MKIFIQKMSEIVGLSADTLRYYEKLGLIRPERDSGNRRVFTEKDIEWIRFIKRLKDIDMPIKDIQKYSELRNLGDCTAKQRMEMLKTQMERLEEAKREIELSMTILENKIDIYKEKIKAQDKSERT